jgi:hypothetical protein
VKDYLLEAKLSHDGDDLEVNRLIRNVVLREIVG